MTSAESFRTHMAESASKDPAVSALVEEACRIMDRLDRIHDFETGKSDWLELLRFRVGDDHETIHVSIDKVVSEARQQAVALKALFAQLGLGRANLDSKPEAVDPVDEIARRRAHRSGGPSSRPVRTKSAK